MNMSSDQLIKVSLLILHGLLLVFAGTVLMGREAAIIGNMFESTLWAILLNLGVISGNKALQKLADNVTPVARATTTTTTEIPANANPAAS